MATMNFSLPEDLKARFDARFAGRNKSAVLAACIEEAIDKEIAREQGLLAFDGIQRLRDSLPRVEWADVMESREQLRAQA